MVKIILEREKCIGCGSCEALCAKYWKMVDDGKVDLLGSKQNPENENYELEIAEIDCNQAASDSCPVQCIKLNN